MSTEPTSTEPATADARPVTDPSAPATKNAESACTYSVLLPTYNEVENLPIVVFLLVEEFEKQFGCIHFFIP